VLGNDGFTLYAAGQASLEQLISSNLSAKPGGPSMNSATYSALIIQTKPKVGSGDYERPHQQC
jgi:hypothetical protein